MTSSSDRIEVYLSLGSNRGDSPRILAQVMVLLGAKYEISGISSLYRTSPQVVLDQPDFYNSAVRLSLVTVDNVELQAWDFLQEMHGIENAFGRDRTGELPKGPRFLDIDIIFWGRHQIRASRLQVPHPEYRHRRFVLVPILEIDPHALDPIDGVPLNVLNHSLENDASQGIYLSPDDHYNSVTSGLRNHI